jgi:hypothetical protein
MTVPPEAFRDWIAPHVAAIRDLATAVDAVPDRHGNLPSASSRAMSELAEERQYGTRSGWEQPVSTAHMFGGATLRAASDYVRGIAELFGTDHPPLYAHLPLARATLESAVISAWLSELGIATEERAKRCLCELLYSAEEVSALGLASAGGDRVAFWEGVGASLGWTVKNLGRGKPTIDGQRRPRISSGIAALADGGLDVANALYSQLSAVDHVTWFGLITAFDPASAERDDRAGTAAVPIGVDGAKVSTILYWVIRVVVAAADARFTLMGWRDEPWREAAAHADTLQQQLAAIAVSRG